LQSSEEGERQSFTWISGTTVLLSEQEPANAVRGAGDTTGTGLEKLLRSQLGMSFSSCRMTMVSMTKHSENRKATPGVEHKTPISSVDLNLLHPVSLRPSQTDLYCKVFTCGGPEMYRHMWFLET